MSKLKDFFNSELPNINTVLQKELQVLNPLVKEVGEYTLLAGGKRLRPLLTLLIARCLKHSCKDIYPLACSLEFLHSATLIHDDILDEAELRRGKKSAHVVFGIKRTVLAGDALLALANMIVARYDVPAMNYCVAEAILQTASGEVEEIDNCRNPEMNEKIYFQIVRGKTAYLIQAAASCGAMAARADKFLQDMAASFGMNLGIAFQLVDDALDYSAETSMLGKPHGNDIREGKITLPLILYLESLSSSEKSGLLQKISNNSLDPQGLENIILNIQHDGFDHRVRELADGYLERARAALYSFPACDERDMLDEMLVLVKTRKF
ncbi:polyprenyl synthetase family protein [Desulfonatronovibrio magnus]|uniref:polyprenyl synthetase family protein n=1 Tax=Desulfonatronovibrio magnus TaxID=698827 RepID=UPI0005EACE17|nr:polyprenyl synthetase family protein [Desulfonatronovibrio magnus]